METKSWTAGRAVGMERRLSPEGTVGEGEEPLLELLSLPDDRDGLRAGREGEKRASSLALAVSGKAFRLTPGSFAGSDAVGARDFRSGSGRRRKAVAADRVLRLRFDAEALVGRFADDAFREA